MNLKKHYDQMWSHAIKQHSLGKFQSDKLIDSEDDNRYGLTLLLRPSPEIRNKISRVLQKIYPSAPSQYYYPKSDIHTTILSIVSCTPNFTLSEIDTQKYIELIQETVSEIQPFKIKYQGLTASPSAVMICGFPDDESLNDLRDLLRQKFRHSSLRHTIDKRYRLSTVHSTIIRFKEIPDKPKIFLRAIEEFRETIFGTCTFDQAELVGNDWYQRKENTRLVHQFTLGKG